MICFNISKYLEPHVIIQNGGAPDNGFKIFERLQLY